MPRHHQAAVESRCRQVARACRPTAWHQPPTEAGRPAGGVFSPRPRFSLVRSLPVCAVLAVGWLFSPYPAAGATAGKFTIETVDKATQRPVAARMHLLNHKKRPVLPPRTVSWKDHFVFDGSITLELAPGTYSFVIERGPEYRLRFGHFTIERGATGQQTIELERFTEMKREGWWSGDLHIHRRPEDIELLMRAEDLHIAPVITWWNNQDLWETQPRPEELLIATDDQRFYQLLAGEDEREGGALLYFNLDQPLAIRGLTREYPSGAQFLAEARRSRAAHIDIEKPFWWDMPMWIATGQADSIGLANNHLWRGGGLFTEAWGKPREKVRYPDPQGNGRWSQDIYYHLLNCGIRIPPSAGSASGVLSNPVGYNRVYVHCGQQLTWDAWWAGLRAGQVVVTNGPLLRPRVNGELPGHVFSAPAGETVALDIALQVSFREPVDYLEIVQNGKVVHEVRLADYAKQQGRLPPVLFQESGWLLIRAVSNNDQTYQFGSTGPYYVEIGQQPRISRTSAQFFADWVRERATRIQLADPAQREEVIRYHRQARDFWQDVLDRANTP
ncbi:MAG: CehA/McbA family metallohydrolase [Pirellulaceae bacterium]